MRISDWSSDVCSSDLRMRIDLKPTHKWEEIRKIMIASGRGTDRIDVMIDLGEKKARKQLPPCFSITPEMHANLAAHDDVIELKLFYAFRFKTGRFWVKKQDRHKPLTHQSINIEANAHIGKHRSEE